MPEQISLTQELISQECDSVKKLLLEKNKSYGNSAIEPVRVFSKTDSIEQINVRIDDKLSRIARGSEYENEDTEKDLIGYLILKRVAKEIHKRNIAENDGLTGSSTSSGSITVNK